jgi:hypothetical protein
MKQRMLWFALWTETAVLQAAEVRDLRCEDLVAPLAPDAQLSRSTTRGGDEDQYDHWRVR